MHNVVKFQLPVPGPACETFLSASHKLVRTDRLRAETLRHDLLVQRSTAYLRVWSPIGPAHAAHNLWLSSAMDRVAQVIFMTDGRVEQRGGRRLVAHRDLLRVQQSEPYIQGPSEVAAVRWHLTSLINGELLEQGQAQGSAVKGRDAGRVNGQSVRGIDL